tara:strand:- start:270 stop:989 length:720 start_codon:yes stop_codon:yes gene_type:complete
MHQIKNFFQKKIIRFKGSKNILKLNFFLHKHFGEKDIGEIGLNFSNKPSKNKIVQDTINRKNYKSYLEIGCFNNELFNYINCPKKVGVDPYSGGTVRETSDDFFSKNKETFDCIFIDGLHFYYQVKKDIINSLNLLNQNGVIFVHDCLPNNILDQAIPRPKYIWTGDVWKAIVEFRTLDHIDTYTCNADMGIGIILKRKNKKKLSLDIKNFSKLKFSDYFKNFKDYMNIVEYRELENLF